MGESNKWALCVPPFLLLLLLCLYAVPQLGILPDPPPPPPSPKDSESKGETGATTLLFPLFPH